MANNPMKKVFSFFAQDNYILMTVLAGEAVQRRKELKDNDLVEKCMVTLRNIFTGEVCFFLLLLYLI